MNTNWNKPRRSGGQPLTALGLIVLGGFLWFAAVGAVCLAIYVFAGGR